MSVLYISFNDADGVIRNLSRTKDELQDILDRINWAESDISSVSNITYSISNYRQKMLSEKVSIKKDIRLVSNFYDAYKTFIDDAKRIDKECGKGITDNGLIYRRETGLLKEEFKKIGKVVLGVLVIAGTVAAAVFIGGPIAIGAAIGACVGGAFGAYFGGVDGFLEGTISGAVGGALGGLCGAPPGLKEGAGAILKHLGKQALVDVTADVTSGVVLGGINNGTEGAIDGAKRGIVSGLFSTVISAPFSVKYPAKFNVFERIKNSNIGRWFGELKWPQGLKINGIRATGGYNPNSTAGGKGLGLLFNKEATVIEKDFNMIKDYITNNWNTPENIGMLRRLEDAMLSGNKISGADLSFYKHELTECIEINKLIPNMSWSQAYEVAHDLAMNKYKVSPYSIYHPDVIDANPQIFRSNAWKEFWEDNISRLKRTGNFTWKSIKHIFEGEINGMNNAVGYHYEGVPSSMGSILSGTKTAPNGFGVYEGLVEVNGILKAGNGGKSSFFPESWRPQEVIDAINDAYNNKVSSGVSGIVEYFYGYTVEGMKIKFIIYRNTGKIISAFPEY